MANFSFNADYTADSKPSLGFEPNDMSWKYQLSGRRATLVTSSPLGSTSVYTQTAIDSTVYPQSNYIAAHIYTDQVGTLYIDVSADNTNWDVQVTFPIIPSVPNFLPFVSIKGKYYRFRYVNGSTPQTTFRLEQIVAVQMTPEKVSPTQVSVETTATTTEASSPFNVSQIIAIKNDGNDSIFINFDASTTASNKMTLKPGDSIGDFPRNCTTLYYKANSGTQAFRAWGV